VWEGGASSRPPSSPLHPTCCRRPPPFACNVPCERGCTEGEGACPFPLWPRGPYVHTRPCAPCVLGGDAPFRARGSHHPACANRECRQRAKGTPHPFSPLAPTQSNRRASTGPPPCRRSPVNPAPIHARTGVSFGPQQGTEMRAHCITPPPKVSRGKAAQSWRAGRAKLCDPDGQGRARQSNQGG
jgi:hypothetical protein